MSVKDIKDADVLDGIKNLLDRAALLGLIPEQGAQVSQRGEFIVNPSNIEELEDKRMRGFKFKEFPKTMHGWDEATDAPVTLSVKNRQEEQNALSVGWSLDPLHGPAGRLDGGKPMSEPEAEPEVREFSAPGTRQPFEPKADEDAPKVEKKKAAPKKK